MLSYMTEYQFNSNTIIDLRDAFNNVFLNSYQFNDKIYEAFNQAYSACLTIFLQNDNYLMKDLPQ